ncbi:MAG: hypothetical protein AAF401_19330 [Pseudomonadota bacterium]
MADCIWHCNITGDTRDHTRMDSWEADDPERYERNIETMRAFKRGEPISPADLPERVYSPTKTKPGKPWREVTIFGFWMFSECYIAPFRDFDLGAGGVHPIEAYEPDREIRIPGDYSLLTPGSKKDAFLPEQSRKFRKIPGPVPYTRKFARDDDLAFSAAALEGPDVWSDVSLVDCFFFSDRLAQRLKREKIATKFRLIRCRIER